MSADGEISYPFTDTPQLGELREVADGVHWLRMPLPFRLDHINLYLLRDGDGWTVVDTGVRGETGLNVWGHVFDTLLRGSTVKRVIATHMHPDHVGQAGWLCRHFDVELWMTRTEFLMCSILTEDGPSDLPADAVRFYERAGFNQHQLDIYAQRFGYFGSMIEALPAGYRRINDGERLDVDGVGWEVIVGRGHSPEHACLYCAERGMLLSGDQVLPRISSNVSVFPMEPAANPLAEWIASCTMLRGRLPAETLVLPSHNEPFTGLHPRLDALVAEHHEGLQSLFDLCASPQRVVDVFPALFRREIGDGNLMLATGESLAHLNYLLVQGRLVKERDDDGVDRYQQA
jgi:glyoxylase-like metal-dependent hydrolase (beta-lactamase superfamily II)